MDTTTRQTGWLIRFEDECVHWPPAAVVQNGPPGSSRHVVAGLFHPGSGGPHFTLRVERRAGSDDHGHPIVVAEGGLELAPACWPWLAPVAALHLCDQNGVPRHALQSARYWAGLTRFSRYSDGTRWRSLPDHNELARHLRVSVKRAEAITAVCGDDQDRFARAVNALRPAWRSDAITAQARLIAHGAVCFPDPNSI